MATKQSNILKGALLTEFKTVASMMAIYCRDHHSGDELCAECQSLLTYAETKLDRCPYGDAKPTCNRCPIHCYKPQPKEQMRLIMRYSGPRMLLPHPILAIRHLIHERKPVPEKPLPKNSNRHHRQLKNK
ncbi:nitrous oxide-stimulated promoter family protein [Vibrio sp. ZSDE26]|uniref:Nitrous oxide-stimulated promoter family protein n=1 Tax=Vibrio amylolyticus TaxID=2847292 RepID=A0A9X1XM81_9VIBR|nr:nitrous oxide-stimulated promoter family protein [Vibrio amylolyticus]MCK6263485.1 nitrous oxide-stimulated promoter family protein [Vibrio amylolyticus]